MIPLSLFSIKGLADHSRMTKEGNHERYTYYVKATDNVSLSKEGKCSTKLVESFNSLIKEWY